MSPPSERRGRLRDLDRHASWREVYAATGVDPDQHEEVEDVP